MRVSRGIDRGGAKSCIWSIHWFVMFSRRFEEIQALAHLRFLEFPNLVAMSYMTERYKSRLEHAKFPVEYCPASCAKPQCYEPTEDERKRSCGGVSTELCSDFGLWSDLSNTTPDFSQSLVIYIWRRTKLCLVLYPHAHHPIWSSLVTLWPFFVAPSLVMSPPEINNKLMRPPECASSPPGTSCVPSTEVNSSARR